MPDRLDTRRLYRGMTAEERARARGEQLDAAAAEIIGEDGFKAATVRAVCGRAGLTQRYYYQHYDDAEAMLITVYRQKLATIHEVLTSAVSAAESPPEMIRSGLSAVFQLIHDDPGLGRIVFLEVLGVSPRVDEAYRAGTQEFVEVIKGLLRSFASDENQARVNADIIGHAAIGAIIQTAVHWILSDFDHSVEEITQNLDLVLTTVATGLSV